MKDGDILMIKNVSALICAAICVVNIVGIILTEEWDNSISILGFTLAMFACVFVIAND